MCWEYIIFVNGGFFYCIWRFMNNSDRVVCSRVILRVYYGIVYGWWLIGGCNCCGCYVNR